MGKQIIYVELLDEGTVVWRPTIGEQVSDMIFKVLATEEYDSEDEHWAYPPGSIVRCVHKIFDGRETLIAVESID